MIDGPRSDPFLKQATDRVAGSDPGVELDLFRLSFALTRAANRFTRHVESAVHRPRNLSTAGFRILFTIWACGPLAAHRIAVLAGLSRASVSSAVNTLERDGHVARSREHDDRRMVTVSLTSSGEAAVRDSYRGQHEVERALYAGLEEGEREELAHLLESLLDAPLG
jgi:DNA-binding MarR family transcriptional regulator|tara:strand:+ start:338 stop:838 length:501 start_codon:yes stop_codon:yes gene_type:complete